MSLRFLLLIFLCGTAAHAREVRLAFSEVGPRAIAQNPELAAARLRIEEARGRQFGAGRLANPELGLEYKNGTDWHERSLTLSFDQRFPVTSRLRLEKEVSAKQVELAEWEIRDAGRRLSAEAQTLAAHLLLLERQRALRRSQIDLAVRLATFIQQRASAGEISSLDATQARVDSQRLVLELRKLENESVSLTGALKARLGLAANDTLVITGELPPLEVPPPASWEKRTDMQRSRIAEEAAQKEVDLAQARKWEDISIGVVLEAGRDEDVPNGLESSGYLGFRVSVPLPLWNNNEGEVREKNAAARRARLETEALALAISHESGTAREEMETSLSLIRETRDQLLPLVQQQTDQLEKAYAAGQIDLLAVLRAREQHLQLEAGLLDAERNFHLARIRHQAATTPAFVGASLPKLSSTQADSSTQ